MATTAEPTTADLRPFREQEPFLKSDRKYYGYISGVGAGKTYAGVLRTALNAEHWNPGEMGAIVAPTTTMIKDVILPIMRETGLLDRWDYKSAHTDEPGIHIPNGGRILLLSADNRRTIERLAGLNLAYWWIDEGPRVEQRAHEILTQRLRVGRYRNGYVTGTPQGKNYIYDEFVGDVDGELRQHGAADVYAAADRLAILRVPSHANPHTPDDFKEQLDRDHDGRVYEQEVLGKFVEFEGLIYDWFAAAPPPEGHIIETEPPNPARTIYGLDWGHRNPAGILCCQPTRTGEWVILEEFKQSRCTVADLADVLLDMQRRRDHGPIYCDPAEPASIEALQRAGLDARAAPNDVQAGIRAVARRADAWRVHERCQSLVNEVGMYRYRDDESEDPVKQQDHLMDAWRYLTLGDEQDGHASIGVVSGTRDDDSGM